MNLSNAKTEFVIQVSRSTSKGEWSDHSTCQEESVALTDAYYLRGLNSKHHQVKCLYRVVRRIILESVIDPVQPTPPKEKREE